MERQKYLFVLNPVAGGIDKSDLVDRIEEMRFATRASILWTEPATGSFLKQEIKDKGYDAVIAAGGDGTVHMVAEALMGTHVPMGIIPLGSGNGLAKDLGIPMDMDEALRVALQNAPTPLDVIQLNGQYSFHICDAGLNAQVVKEYALGSFRTIRAYAWQLLKQYFSAQPTALTLYVDEVLVYEGLAYMAALCNGRRYGTDLLINPGGQPDDGVMEIVVLKDFTKTDGPNLLLDLMAGELDPTFFFVFPGKTCRFTTSSGWPWQLDGEYMGEARSFSGTLHAGAVQVLRSRHE